MAEEVDITIIGAGVVGLAIAAEVAGRNTHTLVVEVNRTFGLETSSRNSEVIHAGIYYPKDSLKGTLCVKGNYLLYQLCEHYGVPYNNIGKIIVATSQEEIAELEQLYQQGKQNGVKGLKLLSRREVKKLEPNVNAISGLLSTATGILDSHALMQLFQLQAVEKEVQFAFNTEVVGIEKTGSKYSVRVKDREGLSDFTTNILINAAGLHSDKIARFAGIDIEKEKYRLHYCKGEYFSMESRKRHLVNRLIYPVPEHAGKGIHLTMCLDGRVRFGPNTRYIDEIDYKVDESEKTNFYNSLKKFLPFIEQEDLEPEFAGVRPKLQGPDDAFRDYIITDETEKGLPGLINLVGIESPGLTASKAIGQYVADIVNPLLS